MSATEKIVHLFIICYNKLLLDCQRTTVDMDFAHFQHLIIHHFNTIINSVYVIVGFVLIVTLVVFTTMYFLSEYSELKRRRTKNDYNS